ncbi:hypothetical protein [Alicyclobacillus ferrooxydans]|uniref:Uncharacterized protein n=1 Tax=Alicyclobacillus ferrooxydans TaxID=471514 RepID=A0A0P9CN75_9BACL|nr:hypothetical protein [Alicyclobacillus ferrooxydans]KPV44361.1 hypothetical protein AN477_06930 [Alicyclobacillus ferrooxydans]
MEYELLAEFENLLVEMEQALIVNDVERISQITDRQQLCLLQIVRKSKTDVSFRAQAKTCVPRWMEQLEINNKLLQQAMSINSTVLQVLYGHEASC